MENPRHFEAVFERSGSYFWSKLEPEREEGRDRFSSFSYTILSLLWNSFILIMVSVILVMYDCYFSKVLYLTIICYVLVGIYLLSPCYLLLWFVLYFNLFWGLNRNYIFILGFDIYNWEIGYWIRTQRIRYLIS
jgi:hypothetical protein